MKPSIIWYLECFRNVCSISPLPNFGLSNNIAEMWYSKASLENLVKITWQCLNNLNSSPVFPTPSRMSNKNDYQDTRAILRLSMTKSSFTVSRAQVYSNKENWNAETVGRTTRQGFQKANRCAWRRQLRAFHPHRPPVCESKDRYLRLKIFHFRHSWSSSLFVFEHRPMGHNYDSGNKVHQDC